MGHEAFSDRAALAPTQPQLYLARSAAEAKAKEAFRLLTEVYDARHSLKGQMASNGRRAFMMSWESGYAVSHARRVVELLSDSAPADAVKL